MLETAREVTGLGDDELLAPIAEGVPVTLAELVFGVTHEGAADVDDLLDRRTRVGLVPADRARLAVSPAARSGRLSAPGRPADEFGASTAVGTSAGRLARGRSTRDDDQSDRGDTSGVRPRELDDFPTLTERYQRELLAHCYRMSGSVHEAEDLVQETFLRAWKACGQLPGPLLGAHLALPDRHQRLPDQPRGPAAATAAGRARHAATRWPATRLEENHEIAWLEPVPDAAVVVAERDSIRLAFVAALQHLPARQRAVLILRDVLRWSAAEVAEALDTTVAAVNSALQRAHAQISERGLTEDTVRHDLDAGARSSCSTGTSTRSGARTSTPSSGCSRPRPPGRCRRSPAGTSAPRTSAG